MPGVMKLWDLADATYLQNLNDSLHAHEENLVVNYKDAHLLNQLIIQRAFVEL